MRNLLITFAALLLAAFIAVTAAPWGLPQSNNFTSLHENEDAIWAVENRTTYSNIYKIKNNTITELYRCSRLDENSLADIVKIYYGDSLFVVRENTDTGKWQVLSPNTSSNLVPVFTLPYKSNYTLLDFQASDKEGFVTVRDIDGSTKVLSTTDVNSDEWVVYLVHESPAAGSVDSALFRDGKLYIALSGGQTIAVSPTGTESISASEMPNSAKISKVITPFGIRLSAKLPIYLAFLFGLACIFLPIFIVTIVRHRSKSYFVRTLVTIVGILSIFDFLLSCILMYRAISHTGIANLPTIAAELGIGLLLFIVFSVIIVAALLRESSHPIRKLSAQMSGIADGDYSVKGIPERRDEIGNMSRSLQELCVSLSIRDYEVDSTMRSYHRFVPFGLEQLLDRASVMEVSLGDNRAINGNTGIITIYNRQHVRHMLTDDDYSAFVDRTFSLLDSTIRTHDGILLSSGYGMESNKIYFRGDEASGAKCALDLLGAAALVQESENHPKPEYFVFLHKTLFLYGIAGNEDNMFPYISSSELEFLGGYSDSMRSAGVKIVMTEQFMEQNTANFVTRYIGFVSSEDYQTSFKLYEVLDSYSDMERNLRINYDTQLQEAITMFYKSDFYLARNLFSSILKACPTDGIARWYLFACEHFFHSNDVSEPNFQLFGINFD